MNHKLKFSIVLICGIFLLSGCAGYDRVLFITKTNVGLDIDDTPPTAEITIARRELAISPTYKDALGKEETLPLLGSFGLTGGSFNPGISSVFAGGDAAVILATKDGGKPAEDDKEKTSELDSSDGGNTAEDEGKLAGLDSSLCLGQWPDTRGPLKRFWHWLADKDYKKIEGRARTP